MAAAEKLRNMEAALVSTGAGRASLPSAWKGYCRLSCRQAPTFMQAVQSPPAAPVAPPANVPVCVSPETGGQRDASRSEPYGLAEGWRQGTWLPQAWRFKAGAGIVKCEGWRRSRGVPHSRSRVKMALDPIIALRMMFYTGRNLAAIDLLVRPSPAAMGKRRCGHFDMAVKE